MAVDLSRSLGDLLESDPNESRRLLARIPGNLLRPHGRNHTALLFVDFSAADAARLRQWVRDGATPAAGSRAFWTSAAVQAEQSADYKRARAAGQAPPETLFCQLLLTPDGMASLGLSAPAHGPFHEGMAARGERLSDPPASEWQAGWQTPFHAVVLLAHGDPAVLDTRVHEIEAELAAFGAAVVHREAGHLRRDAEGRAIGAFGFVDGISQPRFDLPSTAPKHEGVASLDLVLTDDGNGGLGSYVVIRKLAQDVEAWEEVVREMTVWRTGRDDAADQELTRALAVGRFRDGTPVALSSTADPSLRNANDFDYADDPVGRRCPRHAHIRKANPRGEARFLSEEEEARRRIVRRGASFSDAETGLIFLSYQADIAAQFEAIQRVWLDNPNFPRRGIGIDVLAGARKSPASPRDMPAWPSDWAAAGPHRRYDFPATVHLRGGTYLLTPGIDTLRAILVD